MHLIAKGIPEAIVGSETGNDSKVMSYNSVDDSQSTSSGVIKSSAGVMDSSTGRHVSESKVSDERTAPTPSCYIKSSSDDKFSPFGSLVKENTTLEDGGLSHGYLW